MAASRRRWAWTVGVGLVLVGLGAVGLSRLDAFLLAKARDQANQWALELGRPVTLATVHTSLGWGVEVALRGLVVGPAQDEAEPLLQLEEVKARVAVWPTLVSRGKEIRIARLTLSRPVLHVVRLPSGETNLERMLRRPGPTQVGSDSPAPTSSSPRIRIDRAVLSGGEIRLIDRTGRDERALAVQDITLDADGFQMGTRLTATLRAAVMTSTQNLRVSIATAPLAPGRVPALERMTLQLEPVDLAPLTGFLPASAGLRAGKLDANLEADFTAARMVGNLHALGLVFAQSPSPLDVRLESDVTGDLRRGDLSIKTLELALGPAQLSGRGEVKGLLSERPVVAGLEVVGKNLDPALIAEHYPPVRGALAGMSGALGFRIHGVDEAGQPGVAVELDASGMRLSLPDRLNKAAGTPLRVNGTFSGGTRGALRFNVRADLSGVDLHPGGLLNKSPGQAMTMVAAGSYREPKLDLTSFQWMAGGDSVTGKGKMELSRGEVVFAAVLQSAHLDADAWLPETARPVESSAAPRRPANGSTEATAASSFELRGHLAIQLNALRLKRTDFQDVHAELEIGEDRVAVQKLTAAVHGGSVALDGSEIRLRPSGTSFRLQGKAQGLQMVALLPRNVPADLVTGQFSGEMALTGGGIDRQTLSRSLAGTIEGKIIDGTFRGGDVVAAVLGPLAGSLPFGGTLPGDLSSKATSLGKELPFALKLGGGKAQLSRPLNVQQERGSLALEGGIGLDGQLDLSGTLALAPKTVDALTRGKVSVRSPVPVGFKVTGPAWEPQITAVDLQPAMRLLAQEAASGGLDKLLSPKAKEGLKRLLGR